MLASPVLSGVETDAVRMEEIMDIFERLKSNLNCNYISDLRVEPYCTKAKEMLKGMEIEECSFSELNDITEYFYGKRFDTVDAAVSFLKS